MMDKPNGTAPKPRMSLTELGNASIGVSGRFAGVNRLKQAFDEVIVFDYFPDDSIGSSFFHIPPEMITSDEKIERGCSRIEAAIKLSDYHKVTSEVLKTVGDMVMQDDLPSGLSLKRMQAFVSEAREYEKVAGIAFMAFRNTLMTMQEQLNTYSADDLLRVGAHGYCLMMNMNMSDSAGYASEIIQELTSAATRFNLSQKYEDEGKIWTVIYEMSRRLPYGTIGKSGYALEAYERLESLGLSDGLDRNDLNPRSEASIFIPAST